ncbi:MAG: DUF134 domain-containing protein [Promethearchaeota archaeon]
MRYRRGWRGRGRPPKPISLSHVPVPTTFTPNIMKDSIPIQLFASELEAMRLVDGEELDQEEAGKRMGVSRGTIWRLVQSGHRKTITALTESRPITITMETKDDL